MSESEREPLLSGSSDSLQTFPSRRTSFQQFQQYVNVPGRRTRTRVDRSNSVASTTSIRSAISAISNYVLESPIFNLPKPVKRFIAIVVWALFAVCVFQLVFLQRTSLSRDFRRLHFSIVGRDEIERLYLRTFQEDVEGEGVGVYLKECNDKSYVYGREVDELKEYMVEKFVSFGFDVRVRKYWVYIPRFDNNSLSLMDSDGGDVVEIDLADGGVGDGLNAFHTYSKSGVVEAGFVFVNYARVEDYESLKRDDVDVWGMIHVVKVNESIVEESLKIAEVNGASAIVLFNEFGKGDGDRDIENRSVKYSSSWPGDPTTLERACVRSYWCSRDINTVVKAIPKVPSLSVSFSTIEQLFGVGHDDAVSVGSDGSFTSLNKNVSSKTLRLENHNTPMIKPLYNVLFEIPGLLDEIVIIGTSRDSLTPNSHNGSAIESSRNALLLSIAEHFGRLRTKGWKPLRTLMVVSWDASKPGMLGSSEFCKDQERRLKKKVVAYVDVNGVSGGKFKVDANPLLSGYFGGVAKKVIVGDDDDDDDDNNNLWEYWNDQEDGVNVGLLGGLGGDFGWFQYGLGIPSCSIGFVETNGDNDSFKNSRSDSLEALLEIDPGLKKHKVLVKFVGLLSLQLVERETIKFNMVDYYEIISDTFDRLVKDDVKERSELVKSIKHHLDVFSQRTKEFDQKNRELQAQMSIDYPWFQAYVKIKLAFLIKIMSYKAKKLDSLFLYKEGLMDRPLLKHSLWAPEKGTTEVLPGLQDAFDSKNESLIERWMDVLETRLVLANELLML